MNERMHTCPGRGCTRAVPYRQLACRDHWYALPGPMRAAINHAYRIRGQGSTAHTAAIMQAVRWLSVHE